MADITNLPLSLFIGLVVLDFVLVLFTFIGKYVEDKTGVKRYFYIISGALAMILSFGLAQFSAAGIYIDSTDTLYAPYLSWIFWPLGAIMLMVTVMFVIEWGMSINQAKKKERGEGGDWRDPF